VRAGGRARTIDAGCFARLMDRLGPFEPMPEIAVAVSGGRDSMALALLTDEWARQRGGCAVALTVDHRLRRGSAAEAHQVKRWLRTRGIAHRTLVWRGAKPATGLQAAARAARYGLLTRWCRRHGMLHLALAHQRDDQAETVLMRLDRKSGADGLAAMAARRTQDGVRLLRPLLSLPRARLTATLEARRQPWIDDPSNADPRFERTRRGAELAARATAGRDPAEPARQAIAAGRARAALEHEVAGLAAWTVGLSPAGYALLQPQPLAAASAEIRRALWGRLLRSVGGGEFLPPAAALARLDAHFLDAGPDLSRTLGGCRIAPWQGRLVLLRETRRQAPPKALGPAETVRWDRFHCWRGRGGPSAARVAMLGMEGLRQVRVQQPEAGRTLPPLVLGGLPALWDRGGPIAVPHLAYRRPGLARLECGAEFRPLLPLTAMFFPVATTDGETI
jgi:tRNA(Ile)-lysidine synthase